MLVIKGDCLVVIVTGIPFGIPYCYVDQIMSVELMNGVLKAITLKVSAQTISVQYSVFLHVTGVLHSKRVKTVSGSDRLFSKYEL